MYTVLEQRLIDAMNEIADLRSELSCVKSERDMLHAQLHAETSEYDALRRQVTAFEKSTDPKCHGTGCAE